MPELVYTYRTLKESDHEAVKKLVDKFLPGFVQNGCWEWKYLLNPNFDHSLIVVTEKDGKIIGCIHWLPGRIRVARNTEIEANLCTDIVMTPDYRRQGVTKSMVLFMENGGALMSKGAIMNYAYFLNKHFAHALGYVPIRSSTKSYLLLRTWERTIRRINETGKRISSDRESQRKLASLNLVMLFRFRCAPPLTIEISKEGIIASGKEPEHAHVIIGGNLGAFSSLTKSERLKWQLLKLLITRRISVKGSLFALFRLWRGMDVILEVLRTTS